MASENRDSNAHTANKKPNRFSLGKKERSGFVCSYIGTRKTKNPPPYIFTKCYFGDGKNVVIFWCSSRSIN